MSLPGDNSELPSAATGRLAPDNAAGQGEGAIPVTACGEWIRKFIVYALAAYIFLVTVIFTTATENTIFIKATFGQTLIFGLTCLWFARLIKERSFVFLAAEFNVPLLCLLLGCALSLILSPFKYYSLMEIAHFVSYFLSVWLIYNNVKTRSEFMLLLWSFVAATVIAITYGLMQKAGYDFIEWGLPVFISTFGSQNFFSAFLILALPTMLGMMLAGHSWLVRVFLAAWLLAGCWCLMIARTRSAWLGIIFALFAFFCLQVLWGRWLRQPRNWPRIGFILGIIVLVIICVLADGNPLDYSSSFANGFKLSYGVEGGTNQVRFVMWVGAAKMWAEKPILGQGIGTFRLMFPRFRPSYYHRWGVSHNTDYPHNEYFGIAADQGIIGLLLFGWFWWTVLFALGRAIRREQVWFWRQLFIGLFCAVTANLGDNAWSPYMRWPSTGVALYFVIGLTFVAIRLAQNNYPVPLNVQPPAGNRNFMKYPLYFMLAAVFTFAALVEWRVFMGELLMKQGETALNLMQAGNQLNDSNRDNWLAAKAAFEDSLQANPYNHSVLYKLAYINLQMGRTQDALATYDKLMAIAPHYAQIHYNAGLACQLLGTDTTDLQPAIRQFQALEQFALATRIEDYPHNQTLTGSTLVSMGEYRRATSHFSRIAEPALFDWQRQFYRMAEDLRRPNSYILSSNDEDARRLVRAIYARSLSLAGTALGMGTRTDHCKLQRYYYRRALVWHPYEGEVLLRRAEQARAAVDYPVYAELLTTVINNTTPTELTDNMVRNNFSMVLNLIARHVNENQTDDEFWDLLAIGQMKLGDLPKALQCAQNALTINPGNALARQHLQEIQQLSAPAGQERGFVNSDTRSAAPPVWQSRYTGFVF